jgi:two-component system response regulator HydG
MYIRQRNQQKWCPTCFINVRRFCWRRAVDDPYFLRVLNRILTDENFQVTMASKAVEAEQALHESSFDVVISDLRLPDGDGVSILESLRRAGSSVPVVILTAYGEVDSYLAAMNAGAVEYLNKPVKSEELLGVVRNCVRPRATAQKARR